TVFVATRDAEHGTRVKRVQVTTGERWQSLGFGGITYLALMIPGVNVVMMPAAVAGATLFWVREKGETRVTKAANQNV
ncbi:hypothetical protein LD001_29955, partial [Pseudomonas kurunegalensis]|nr:hypothetical protein [Pseudomonas kurunegalensis]